MTINTTLGFLFSIFIYTMSPSQLGFVLGRGRGGGGKLS